MSVAGAEVLSAGISMRGISKRFGPVQANLDLDLDFRRGEVHALLGENGAGKSTVMNVLTGMIIPDEGDICIDGELCDFSSPRDALRAGVGMVHQDFRLVDRLSAAENLHLGWDETPRFLNRGELAARATELAERFNLPLEPDAKIWQLSMGDRQRLAILRALSRGANVLILDEPTAVLTPQESERLFETVERMMANGTTVIFISHKLREVLEVATTITVLRRGRRIASVSASDTDAASLASLMIGREVESVQRAQSSVGESERPVVARLEQATVLNDYGLPALKDVSLRIRAGEILGIAGVAGNGQQELAHVLTGLRPPESGRVLIGERDLSGAGVLEFTKAGVGYVPEDRRSMGCVPAESITQNAILKSTSANPVARGPFVSSRAASKLGADLVEAAHLSTSELKTPVGTLSGGNIQRLIVAREMRLARALLVASYPSRGLDVGAIENVHRALDTACKTGLGVLLISEELDELLVLADRIVVLYEGTIAGETSAADRDIDRIGLWMGGAREPDPGRKGTAGVG